MLTNRTMSQTLITASLLAFVGSTFAQPASAPADPKENAKTPATSSDAARGLNVSSLGSVTVHPGTQTLSKLMRTVTIEFKDNTLEDCLKFIHDVTGVDMEILWIDDKNSSGLAKETPINVTVKNLTALALLEKVLDRAGTELSGGGGSTWQLTDGGSLQIGTKERLNKFRRLEIYDISDMLFEVTNKTNAPQFDLQQAFQSGGGGGGGGGQSPFQQNNQQNQDNLPKREDQAKTIRSLITSLVETDQWSDNGGDGGSITYWQGTLLINAPDYMHRQVDGYKFWPNSQTQSGTKNGRRYVSLDSKVQVVSPPNFTSREIQAVTGGGR